MHPESSLVGCWLVQNIVSESFTVFCRDLMVYSPVLLIVAQHNGVLNRIGVSWQNKASALHLRATTLKFYTDKWRRCSYYVLARGHMHRTRFSFLTAVVRPDRWQQMFFYCISNDPFPSTCEAPMCPFTLSPALFFPYSHSGCIQVYRRWAFSWRNNLLLQLNSELKAQH